MLDYIWDVYNQNGEYLGRFETSEDNSVLMVSDDIAAQVSSDTVLHMDSVFTFQAWEVRVIGPYEERSFQFKIEKVRDRQTRYPAKPTVIHITYTNFKL